MLLSDVLSAFVFGDDTDQLAFADESADGVNRVVARVNQESR